MENVAAALLILYPHCSFLFLVPRTKFRHLLPGAHRAVYGPFVRFLYLQHRFWKKPDEEGAMEALVSGEHSLMGPEDSQSTLYILEPNREEHISKLLRKNCLGEN